MDYLNKLRRLSTSLKIQQIEQQYFEIDKIVKAVMSGRVLEEAPTSLGLNPDILQVLLHQKANKQNQIKATNNLLNNLRQYLAFKYGIWSLPNLKVARTLNRLYQPKLTIELMAGRAYWSKALNQVGMTVIATDSLEWAKTSKTGRQPFYQVKEITSTDALKRYRQADLFICSWTPNFGNTDITIVQYWKKYSKMGSHLLFIGEKNGATNSSNFWQTTTFKRSHSLNQLNHYFKSYDFINEKFYEIDRHEMA